MPLGDVADVVVREAPEMIRNDNGELAGYIYVYLRDVTGLSGAARVSADQPEDTVGYSMEWTGNYIRRGGAVVAAYRRADHAGNHVRAVDDGVQLGSRQLADSLSAPFALVEHSAPGRVGLFDDYRRHHRLRVALRRGDPDGIIMIEFIREALANRSAEQSYMDAVVQGSVARSTEADDGGHDRPWSAADHVRHWFWDGHHQADRHSDVSAA